MRLRVKAHFDVRPLLEVEAPHEPPSQSGAKDARTPDASRGRGGAPGTRASVWSARVFSAALQPTVFHATVQGFKEQREEATGNKEVHGKGELAKLFPFLCLVLALFAAGCVSSRNSHAPSSKPIPVIFDTDIGDDIDDTWALGFLLRCPELDVKLVLGDNGKPDYRARLLAKFLEAAGRNDVPVGLGLDVNPKNNEPQSEWAKDYDLKKYPGRIHPDGVQALIDTIMKSRRPITVIAVGPVQNLAEALRREPRIAERARFVGMHGSVRVGYGNNPKVSPEYNVKTEPKACQKVFTAPWDMTITPLDTCDKIALTGGKYQRVYQSADPIAAAIVANYRGWAAVRGPSSTGNVPIRSTTLFDTVAVYLAFNQELCAMEKLGIRVNDEGFTLEDPAAKQMNVAISWKNLAGFEDLLVERLTSGR